jgi:hypothetical protein
MRARHVSKTRASFFVSFGFFYAGSPEPQKDPAFVLITARTHMVPLVYLIDIVINTCLAVSFHKMQLVLLVQLVLILATASLQGTGTHDY